MGHTQGLKKRVPRFHNALDPAGNHGLCWRFVRRTLFSLCESRFDQLVDDIGLFFPLDRIVLDDVQPLRRPIVRLVIDALGRGFVLVIRLGLLACRAHCAQFPPDIGKRFLERETVARGAGERHFLNEAVEYEFCLRMFSALLECDRCAGEIGDLIRDRLFEFTICHALTPFIQRQTVLDSFALDPSRAHHCFCFFGLASASQSAGDLGLSFLGTHLSKIRDTEFRFEFVRSFPETVGSRNLGPRLVGDDASNECGTNVRYVLGRQLSPSARSQCLLRQFAASALSDDLFW